MWPLFVYGLTNLVTAAVIPASTIVGLVLLLRCANEPRPAAEALDAQDMGQLRGSLQAVQAEKGQWEARYRESVSTAEALQEELRTLQDQLTQKDSQIQRLANELQQYPRESDRIETAAPVAVAEHPLTAVTPTTPRRVSGVMQFGGSEDYIAIYTLHYESAGAIDAVTVEAWVKTSSQAPQIIASWDRAHYWRLAIGAHRRETRRRVLWATTDAQRMTHDSLGTARIADGQWHFVAVTYEAARNSKRIYVDGQLDRESAAHDGYRLGTGMTRYGFLGVGSEARQFDGKRAPHYYLHGSIAEVRIWNVARAPEAIQADMHQRLTGREAGLVGYWPLDRIEEHNGASMVLDLTPNQHHGLVHGVRLAEDPELPIASSAPVAQQVQQGPTG